MLLISYLILSVPLALLWMALVNQITLEAFIVGYALALCVVLLLRPRHVKIVPAKLPGQLFSLALFLGILFRDITLSGIDVARRVLSPDMRLKLGIIAVPTQDETKNDIITALSADVITLTPGELVVKVGDDKTLYVHCLDVEASAARMEQVQAQRLRLFNRILGRES